MDPKAINNGGSSDRATPSPSSNPRPKTACPACQSLNFEDSRFCQQCAAPLKETPASASFSATIKAPSMDFKRGSRIAVRYEIIEELGQGGMGRVFKVFDQQIHEMIALKLIRPEIGSHSGTIERFTNELKFTRKITHRNICRMHDLGQEGFLYFITMEYVSGEDLKRFIKRSGSLTMGKAVFLARQICEGLSEAHRIGAVHRDMKPQNVMIDQEGNAKIMDFGIARFVDMDRMTGSGVMIGTPEYMSPEQAEVKDVDRRADLYSLGVVLFEMVTGRVPFEGETALSLAMKHKTEKPKNVREWNAQVPVALADIIAKCLEKSPDKRYQSAQELNDDLAKVEQGFSTAERVVSKKKFFTTMAVPSKTGRKKLVAAAAALGVVVLAVAGILILRPGRERLPAFPGTSDPAAPENRPQPKSAAGPPPSGSEKEAAAKTNTPPPAVKPEAAKPGSALSAPVPPPAADVKAMNLAKARLVSAKGMAAQGGFDAGAMFFRLAETLEREAQKSVSLNKIVDARCRYSVAEKLFRLCLDRKKDEDRLSELKKFIKKTRDDADEAISAHPGDDLLKQSREAELRGDALRAINDVENAAKAFAQAAIGYEKIRWVFQTAGKK